MEVVALVLAALLTVACVLFVAGPLLRPGRSEGDALEPVVGEERLRRLEERDRALAALKELEFDHRTGKISDEDYRALVGQLRRAAAETLRALESEEPGKGERERVDVHR